MSFLMSQSINELSPAIVKAQASLGNAIKDSKNPFFKSKYADLNSIREAVLPAYSIEGMAILQPTVYYDGKSFVRTLILHKSGQFMSADTEIIVGKGTAQDHGSGISYARRYGLQSFTNVGAVDDDGNLASGKQVEVVKTETLSKHVSVPELEEAVAEAKSEIKKSSFKVKTAPKAESSADKWE